MSEHPVSITSLNDYIFCPASIYFHALDEGTEKLTYQSTYQINGSVAHQKPDEAGYSTRKDVWQGREVYCEKYDLIGKIDVYFRFDKKLVERKKLIKQVYDGYVFQLYAQYFALQELGENVETLILHSLDDNRSYQIKLPGQDEETLQKFETTIQSLKSFSFESFVQENSEKCKHCIYNPMCFCACTRELDL